MRFSEGFIQATEEQINLDIRRLVGRFLPEYRISVRVDRGTEGGDGHLDLFAQVTITEEPSWHSNIYSHALERDVPINLDHHRFVCRAAFGRRSTPQDVIYHYITEALYNEIASHLIQLFPDRNIDRDFLEPLNHDPRADAWRYANQILAEQMDMRWSTAGTEAPFSAWVYPGEGLKQNQEAEEKAEKLLLSCLSRQQKKDYKQHEYFIVIGNATGNRYKITKGRIKNIYLIHDYDDHVARHCVESNERVPMGDHLLAQKLLIEANEEEFLRVKIDWNL